MLHDFTELAKKHPFIFTIVVIHMLASGAYEVYDYRHILKVLKGVLSNSTPAAASAPAAATSPATSALTAPVRDL